MKKHEARNGCLAGHAALERVLVEAARREPITNDEQSAWTLQNAIFSTLHSAGRAEALARGLRRRTVHDFADERVFGQLLMLSTKLEQSRKIWFEQRKSTAQVVVAPYDPGSDEISKSWKLSSSGEPNL